MSLPIWDAHSCLPLSPEASLDVLSRHHNAGVRHISINVGMDINPLSQIMSTLASFRAQIAAHPLLMQVSTWEDISKAKDQNLLAVSFDLEGALPLLESTAMVGLYHRLGVRQIHLAYNRNNSIAGGCHDSPQGLTALGKKMISCIQEQGIILDMSHNSIETSLDICAYATKPVIFSHANSYALCPHPRNITKEQIKACAQTGGVICINGVERFLGEASAQAFVAHLCNIVEEVGIKHVGIGLDTMLDQAGISDMPKDIDQDYWWPKEHYAAGIGTLTYLQPEDYNAIQQELERAGFSQEERYAISFGNMSRIAQICWT